jgi:hypothetical protein
VEKDIGELLDSIVWGHKIVSTIDGQFVFRPLSLQDRNISNHIHQEALNSAKNAGRKTKAQLKIDALKRGIWKPHFDNDLKSLKEEFRSANSEKEKLEQQAKGKRQLPSSLIVLNKRMEFLLNTISEIERIQSSCIELPSIEYHAEQERAYYAVSQAALCFPSMTKRWHSFNDFMNEPNTQLVHALVNAYYRSDICDEAEIRAVARSPVWRIKWSASKKNGGARTLFGRDMYDITVDQFRLIYWSQIYDSAYESLEPPTDETIADDKLFDAWLEEQHEKRKQKNAQKSIDNKLKNARDGQEVGVMVDGYYSDKCTCGVKGMPDAKFRRHASSCSFGVFLYYPQGHSKKTKEVESIQSANPEHVRKLLGKEQDIIARKGTIAEQDLRRDESSRAALGMSTKLSGRDGPKGRAR